MSETNDGGPAFPCPNDAKADEMGATLRDYFAAQAMNGMLSYSYLNPSCGNFIENCSISNAAVIAYQYADAMLKARQQ